jgi:hypothetical protein
MESNGAARGFVATLDSSLLERRDYLNCFSDAERQEILGTRHIQRRLEKVAGRLAAKFLFLGQRDGLPPLMHLSAADLDRYSASEYSSAEVFRNEHVLAGLPWICGPRGEGQTVALAHAHGLACAYLGNEGSIAVDLESIQPRTPAFYQGNFTPRERTWAAQVSGRLALPQPWLFTFLWTVKECLLKTPWFRDLSIADFPSMNVRITSGEEQLSCPYSAQQFLAGFVFLQADVEDASRTVQVNLALSGRHDLILTALQRRVA